MAFCTAAGLLSLDYEAHSFVLGAYSAGISQREYDATDLQTLCREGIEPILKERADARSLYERLYVANTGGERPNLEVSGERLFSASTYGGPLAIRKKAFENLNYSYLPCEGVSESELNESVLRIGADPNVRGSDPNFSLPTGEIASPLMMVHTTGDTSTPISVLSRYRSLCEKAGKSSFLVQRAIRATRHCGFTGEEKAASWRDLFDWVENGKAPEGDDLQGSLAEVGAKFSIPD